MGHSGSSAKGGAAGSGAKGWGDVVKAGLNPLADFTGVKDPLVGAFGKTMQKYSPNDEMTSTYDSRVKEYDNKVKEQNAAVWEASAAKTKAKADTKTKDAAALVRDRRGPTKNTSLLGEDE